MHSFCDEQLCIALCRCLKEACRRVDRGASATRWCGRWEKRRRWRRVSREVIDTFLLAHIYVSSCVLPLAYRGTCAMHREWQSAGCSSKRARARARDLHSLFHVDTRSARGIVPIDEISMMHPSPLQGPRFRSSYFFDADAFASSTFANANFLKWASWCDCWLKITAKETRLQVVRQIV